MRLACGVLNFNFGHLLVTLCEGAEVRDLDDVLLLGVLSQMCLFEDEALAAPRFSPVHLDRYRLPAVVLEDFQLIVALVETFKLDAVVSHHLVTVVLELHMLKVIVDELPVVEVAHFEPFAI